LGRRHRAQADALIGMAIGDVGDDTLAVHDKYAIGEGHTPQAISGAGVWRTSSSPRREG
jgi:hypothetical protein